MSIKVLLADDHTVVRDGLRLVLEGESDIEVVDGVGTGREAVRYCSMREPDVVVMDITMPDLNGIDATRQITALGLKTRVVMLSMHATAEHIYRSFEAGALGYLLKESAAGEVVGAVRSVSRGRRFLGKEIADTVVEAFIKCHGAPAEKSPLDSLSTREREILQLVVEGKSSLSIGTTLAISPKTVDTCRSRLMQKLGIGDLPALVRFAIEHGIIGA